MYQWYNSAGIFHANWCQNYIGSSLIKSKCVFFYYYYYSEVISRKKSQWIYSASYTIVIPLSGLPFRLTSCQNTSFLKTKVLSKITNGRVNFRCMEMTGLMKLGLYENTIKVCWFPFYRVNPVFMSTENGLQAYSIHHRFIWNIYTCKVH